MNVIERQTFGFSKTQMVLAEQIKRAFSDFSGNNAFCINDIYFTYAQLEERVSVISSLLHSTGNSTAVKVGVVTNNSIDTYASILACWRMGYVYVPLNCNYPPERNDYIINQAEVEIILNSTADVKPFSDVTSVKTINTWEHLAPVTVDYEAGKISEKDMAYMLFTSGSTGMPKGVPITYGNLQAFVDNFEALNLRFDETDRCIQMYELTFDLSIVSFLMPLLKGACVYTVPDDVIKYTHIIKLATKHQLTVLQIVPSVIKLLKPILSRIDLPSVRLCILGGEATDVELLPLWQKAIPKAIICNMYGPTEATIYCMYYAYDEQYVKQYNGMFAIGRPMPNVQMVIINDAGEIADNEVKGELCIAGTQVTEGYLNNEEKNKTSFINLDNGYGIYRYYKTGDMCYRDNAGDYYYCGRFDNQVKIQGYRIELSEIEFAVRKLLNINNVVVAVKNQYDIPELVLVLETINAVNEEAFFNDIQKELPVYMKPSRITYLNQFPLNSSGKTDRKNIEKIVCAY